MYLQNGVLEYKMESLSLTNPVGEQRVDEEGSDKTARDDDKDENDEQGQSHCKTSTGIWQHINHGWYHFLL